MSLALQEAQKALAKDEIPIGAILVKENDVICRNHNRTKELNSPLAHAEKLILDAVEDKYLYDYTLYITLEPCLMCAGMIIWKRVGRVVFGAYDKKAGAVGSIYNTLLDKNFNHHPKLSTKVLEEECASILSNFFKSKRKGKINY